MRCGIYVRISTDEQRDNGYSIDYQLWMINFLEYGILLLISAQVMEMAEKEQSNFVYERLDNIYSIII